MDQRVYGLILGILFIFIKSGYSQVDEGACFLQGSYIHCKGSQRVVLPSVDISNVKSILITSCNMSGLTFEDFADFPQVINIEIRSSHLSFPTNNGLFKRISELKYLRIENCGVGEEVVAMFAENESLEALSLSKNRITSFSRRFLSNFTQLQELDLSGNGADHLEEGAFDELKELRLLDLSDNALSGGSAGVVALTPDRCSVCRASGASKGCSRPDVSQCVKGRSLDRIWWRSTGLKLRLEGNPACNDSAAPLETESSGESYRGDIECDVQDAGDCFEQESRKLFFNGACGKKHPNSSDVSNEERYVIKAGIPEIALYSIVIICLGCGIGFSVMYWVSKRKQRKQGGKVSFNPQMKKIYFDRDNEENSESKVPEEVDGGTSTSEGIQEETVILLDEDRQRISPEDRKIRRLHSVGDCEEIYDTIDSRVSLSRCSILNECVISRDSDSRDGSPLSMAALEGDLEKVNQLLENREDRRVKNSRGESVLWFAVLGGHQKIVQRLCQEIPQEVEGCNQNGDTPLHVAVHEDNEIIVKLLLEAGAPRCARNKNGQTPLHIAVYRKNLEIIKLLLNDHVECVNQGNIQGDSPLFLAVRVGQVKVVHILLEKGADPNFENLRGEKPIHVACWHARRKIIEILLSKGSNLKVKDRYGNTELHVACRRGHLGIVKELLSRGSDINAVNKKNHTPLHRAVKGDHSKIVEFLIQEGADVDMINRDGETPSQKAINLRKQKCINVFMNKRKCKSMEIIIGEDDICKRFPSSQCKMVTI